MSTRLEQVEYLLFCRIITVARVKRKSTRPNISFMGCQALAKRTSRKHGSAYAQITSNSKQVFHRLPTPFKSMQIDWRTFVVAIIPYVTGYICTEMVSIATCVYLRENFRVRFPVTVILRAIQLLATCESVWPAFWKICNLHWGQRAMSRVSAADQST